jgi:hypothetical protein
MKLIPALWACALIFPLSLLTSCTTLESQSTEYVRDDSRSLRRALFDHKQMLLVYGVGETEASDFAQWAQELAANSRRIEIIIRNDQEITTEELNSHPTFLIGSFPRYSIVHDLIDQLPFSSSGSKMAYQEIPLKTEREVGILSYYPHPCIPQFPIGAVLGDNDQEILSLVKENANMGFYRSIWSRWGYQIYRNGQRTLLGNFNQDWEPDSILKWQFSYEVKPVFESKHFSFVSYSPEIKKADIEKISRACEGRVEEIISFIQPPSISKVPKIKFFIYPSAEQMALMNNRMVQSFIEFDKKEAHVIINQEYTDNFVEKENQIILAALLGNSRVSALKEGLSIYFAPHWQQKGYNYWSASLYRSHNLIPLKDLLDNDYFRTESPLIRGAMAGSLVDFLIETWGKETFLKKYTSWNPQSAEIASLEPLWRAYHDLQAQNISPVPKRPLKDEYFKGMTFSHEGYSIYDGYGSKMGAVSLQALKDIHANSVAIVPYSGSRSTYEPSPYYLSNGPGGENDASVVYAHHAAQTLGLTTMLKPQLWFPGAWPGEVEMKSEADWDQFFVYYRRWIRHYAMLAEIHQMDILCVGVEFVKATRAHPENWSTLIKDLREIYRGPITYAANWGEEFENLSFADDLDFVGLNFYYPLSGKKGASPKELKKGLEKVLEDIRKQAEGLNKPIVLTEIGFRSIAHPWIQPHAEAEDRVRVEKDQALCYEIILEALKDEPWCKGMYWWKWPSFMEYAHQNPTSFTPCGKEAEKVLEKYYKQMNANTD